MAKDRSFQNEVPPSRVNIRYVKDTGGAREEMELPFRMLVMGDFTLKEDATPIEDRKRISVSKDNFEAVLREQKLSLDLVVENKLTGGGDEMPVKLKFDSLKAFSPESVANQIPELATLLQVREVLKDLKARIVTNREFRKALEKILQSKEDTVNLLASLDKLAPLPDVSKDK